jgi:multiple sugar transport system permease protein
MSALGRQRWLGPAMFLPAILYVVALVGVPFVLAFFYAVGDVKVGSVGYHFVGLANFQSVLQSPAFLRALRNSFVFTICSHILVLIGANILAMALKNAFPGRKYVRFLILLPLVAPCSIGSIGSGCRLSPASSTGCSSASPRRGSRPGGGEPGLAMMSVILMHTWHMLPSPRSSSGGVDGDPEGHPEAAAVDGAGFYRRVFQIESR